MYEQEVTFIYRANAPLTYKVFYDGNMSTGGTLPLDNTDYLEGQLVNNPGAVNLVKDGYIFTGWNTNADGNGVEWNYAVDTMPANNLTLYTQWKIDEVPPIIPEVPEQPEPNPESDNQDKEQTSTGLPKTGNGSLIVIGSFIILIGIAFSQELRKNK